MMVIVVGGVFIEHADGSMQHQSLLCGILHVIMRTAHLVDRRGAEGVQDAGPVERYPRRVIRRGHLVRDAGEGMLGG